MIRMFMEWLFKPALRRRDLLAFAVRMERLARAAKAGGNERAAWQAIQKGNQALKQLEEM